MTVRFAPPSLIVAGVAALLLIAWFVQYARDPVSMSDAVDMRGHEEASIRLTEDGFVPERLRVDAGTHIVFSTELGNQFWPASNPHPSHTIYDQFDPNRPIAPGETWTFEANEAGVWGYHDHLRSFYTGILYVEE
jgi:hypothetical protein